MSLSQPSIGAIVSALLHERKYLTDEQLFWAARARADPTLARYLTQINTNLQVNADALHEIAMHLAPWLKQHPEYTPLTTAKD